ncbi:MAG: hypothetical protein K0R17_1155 [Rariglobus sp.]|nr:hypothetical protein [Rariglobus sp.]
MALTVEEIRRQVLEQKAREAQLRPLSFHPSTPPAASSPTVGATPAGASPPSSSPPQPAASLPPWLLPAQPAAPQAPAAQATTPPFVAPAVVPAPAPARPSQPLSVPTFVRFFKVCIAAVIVLACAYFSVKSAYPFLMEMARPGSMKAVPSKDVPTSVKILQQTRDVVAKSNANVDHLNAIIGEPLGAALPDAPPLAPLPPPPALPAPKPKPQVRLERLTGLVIDELHISGVLGGKNPRIMVDGVMIYIGGTVDMKRRLRFIAIDETRRVIVLGNGFETIEKAY